VNVDIKNFKLPENFIEETSCIRDSISKSCEEYSQKYTNFIDDWLRNNIIRKYGYIPPIEFLKSDNWNIIQSPFSENSFMQLVYNDEIMSTIKIRMTTLDNYSFHYIIENNDGFTDEGYI
jgi:hypothetical protein